MLWEIAEAALKRDDNKEFRQKNHMVHARRVRRVSQVRPYDTLLGYGTSEGANKGWDSRGRGRAKKNFEPPSSVVKKDPDDEMKKLHQRDEHGRWSADAGGMLSTEKIFGSKVEELPLSPAMDVLEDGGGMVTTVDPQTLIPTQDEVGADKVNDIAAKFDSKKAMVQGVSDQGKIYIFDGHHTAVAAIKNGIKSLKIRVVSSHDVPEDEED